MSCVDALQKVLSLVFYLHTASDKRALNVLGDVVCSWVGGLSAPLFMSEMKTEHVFPYLSYDTTLSHGDFSAFLLVAKDLKAGGLDVPNIMT